MREREGEREYEYDIQDMKICEEDKHAQRIKSSYFSCNLYRHKRRAVPGKVQPQR